MGEFLFVSGLNCMLHAPQAARAFMPAAVGNGYASLAPIGLCSLIILKIDNLREKRIALIELSF